MKFGAILRLKLHTLQEAADDWASVGTSMNTAAGDFTADVASPIGSKAYWEGEDADEASATCTGIRLDLEAVAKEAKTLGRYLADIVSGAGDGLGNGNLTDLQRDAHDLLAEIAGEGMTVDEDDNTVRWAAVTGPDPSPEAQKQLDEMGRKADRFTVRVKDLCAKADTLDASLAAALPIMFGTKDTFRTENRQVTDGEAGLEDRWTEAQMAAVSKMMRHKYGYDDAADLLDHFLKGGGEPYEIDADDLLADCPPFQKDVKTSLAQVAASDQPEGSFTTEWAPSDSGFESEAQRNWYYGLYHFQYRLVGTKQDGEIDYHVEVQKRYDWGTPSEHRGDLEKSLAGYDVVDIEQADVAELNRVGLAQDFDVHGSTGAQTSRY
ncbi:hypothetical protein GTY65_36445 [Streptomyces sp. SID8379]|uniref:hypothetical protein n=1 Tax=unclassified Streptomyces TaxID=2593676 RepID=UPI00036FECED|nr:MULTISPECIES: hypothetical protein [unclassified Streptomyces]MYW69518.1 hypothetical protein [Streptomyces sp. SID8379]